MPQKLAARREARLRERNDPPPFAIGTPEARFGPGRRVFAHRALEGPDILRGIVRMNRQLPFTSLHLPGGNTTHLAVCPVDELNSAGRVGHPQHRRAAIRHDAEAILTFAENPFNPLTFGDVFHMSYEI